MLDDISYKINDLILFTPATSALSFVKQPDIEPILISNITKRLLLLLLTHQGEVVSRNLLFQKVWDNYGLISSDSNLNQCVSKLRRLIKSMGLDEEFITTAPKMGFMLRSEIQIEAEKYEQDENNSQQEPPITERTHSPPVQPIETFSEQKKISGRRKKWLLLVSIALVVVILIATLSIYYLSISKEIYIGKVGECKTFIADNSLYSPITEDARNNILEFLKAKDVSCKPDDYILVNRSNRVSSYISDISRIFVVKCKILRENKIEICESITNERTL
ncbi:MAG: winged helix-turn-helix domain-containing protein [Hafnia sp.]|uniref:winged helix-turn-helix domain-containing protein n=1 Tax=Hafnia TaxID=568 RepID=UPI00187D1394|nr:winged helix-turn-helix domain-containing protein [Hafnia alvei]MCE9874209.1 winged helix-turn-helix domain-containing protein [Hafnia alvei]